MCEEFHKNSITRWYVSSFINSGVGLVLYVACFSPSVEQQKQVYNYKANYVGVVYYERTNHFT